MEPQIRYCTSFDGVRIAYTAVGQGAPLVFVPAWAFNIELTWREPDFRHLLEALCRERLLVLLERRGGGCSQRDVDDMSMEAQLRDIDAVADHLQLQRFSLWGVADGASVSVAYAARDPERVSRIVLWAPYPDGAMVINRDALDSLIGLVRNNWSLARRAVADMTFPTGPTEAQRWFSGLLRQSISQETAADCLEFQNTVDVSALLPQVRAPALILHRRDCSGVPIEAGRACAALIPNVRFVTLEGDILHPFFGDTSYVKIVNQFLKEDEGGRRTTDLLDLHDAAPERLPEGLEGKTISHYKILEKLGEGGMGVVYKAEDTILHRPVALKFLSQDLTKEHETRERFLREARAAAALDHPNICTVHEIAEDKDQTFIAMAHIDGQSLNAKIESGPLEVKDAVSLTIEIAEGLEEAHEKGIVHRDIKTANIMVTRRGHVRIMDFGLAKLSGQTRLTKTATIMGTVSYMSPEQARGETDIDHRTDVWSLGVVLYEMLAGKLPFDAPSDAALLHKIIYEPEEPIRSFRQDLPASLEQVLAKMLQKNPQDRYEDMEAFIADLTAIKAGAAPQIMVKERDVPSIVVLPFADMSPAKDQEYFCDGIAEELINALTQIADLRVIARTSAFSFKDHDIDVRDIGKKLDVGVVLEGSVRKAGNQLRVTAQLVDVARGHHLWSEKYDRSMEDIFAIQDEISETIVDKLKPRLFGKEEQKLSRRQIVDIEAYNLCLRGRWFWNKMTDEAMSKAIECFEQAIEKAPGYAPAYAGLSDVYTNLPLFSYWDPVKTFPKAKEATKRALEIDDTLAEPHTSLGWIKMFYDWDWENAEKEFKRAITLNPSYALAHNRYAMYLFLMTRFENAIEEIGTALELDPLSIIINHNVGEIFLASGQYDQAEEAFKRTIEMDPGYTRARHSIVRVYLQKSMYAEAMEEIEKQERLSKGFDPLYESFAGIVDVLMGKRVEGEQKLDDLLKRSTETYVPPSFVAGLYFALDEKDQGFRWLDKAYEKRDSFLALLKVNPVIKAFDLQTDPRYRELLIKMGLERPDTTVPIIEQSPSIVVLPFANLSADPEQEYFCDGLAEELINALTQLRDLHVVARTSAFSFKGKEMDVRQIGDTLNVKSVLEGSVRKAGNRLRITAQLVNVSDGYHLWSERYDREMDDVFAIQDEITLAIVDKLKPKLLREEKAKLARRQTVDLEAYNLYLKGRWFYGKQTGHGLKKAIECFGQAIEKAPDYAQAYAGIADSYVMLPFLHSFAPREAYPKAREAALKAMEIDDTAAEAQVSLALILHVYEYDWDGAEKEFKRAIELNPGYAMAHDRYALFLLRVARFDEGIAEMKRALELDPLSLQIHRDAGFLFCFARKPDQAMDIARRLLELDPNYSGAHGLLGYAHFLNSMYEEAIEELRKEKEVPGGMAPRVDAALGAIDALTGKTDEAEQVLENLIKRSKKEYIPPSFIAGLSFVVEGTDQGFDWLDKAYEEHDNWLCHLKVDPLFELLDLRSDPRYIALLKKINLEP
jgi:TolB-like protein/Tfp pilus assembly protein PilF/pimeloyl-ACP methyl ester carboxylesterase/predicted Ser/Thr protein kinase